MNTPKVVAGAVALAVLCLGGCRCRGRDAAAPVVPGAPDAPSADTPKRPPLHPETGLVLFAADEKARTVRLAWVDPETDPAAPPATAELPAPADPRNAERIAPVLTARGAMVAGAVPGSVSTGEKGAYAVRRLVLGRDFSTPDIALDRYPASLLLSGNRLLAGTPGVVLSFDIGTPKAPQSTLFEAPAERSAGKAFDFFLENAPDMVAVDDVVVPHYAEHFRMKGDGGVEHVASWSLPTFVNGTYREGALDAGEVLLVAFTGHMGGSGQHLMRLPVDALDAQRKPVHDMLGEGAWAGAPAVEEFSPRTGPEAGATDRVLAGERMTRWRGLCVLGGHVLVGARERGVLVLPRKFDGSSKATALGLGGPVKDLARGARSAWALVHGAEGDQVVEIAADEAGARAGSVRVEARGRWDGFAR